MVLLVRCMSPASSSSPSPLTIPRSLPPSCHLERNANEKGEGEEEERDVALLWAPPPPLLLRRVRCTQYSTHPGHGRNGYKEGKRRRRKRRRTTTCVDPSFVSGHLSDPQIYLLFSSPLLLLLPLFWPTPPLRLFLAAAVFASI